MTIEIWRFFTIVSLFAILAGGIGFILGMYFEYVKTLKGVKNDTNTSIK